MTIPEASWLIDNQAMVTSRAIPHSSSNKCHNTNNPADVVCNQWTYWKVEHFLKALLLYSGDTNDRINRD
jgi:hypothetical protein